ncbi:hypothetical protein OH492_12340 [Vibrio chagasii]|nr:hypothetical protein [Vibrio chagasii]
MKLNCKQCGRTGSAGAAATSTSPSTRQTSSEWEYLIQQGFQYLIGCGSKFTILIIARLPAAS